MMGLVAHGVQVGNYVQVPELPGPWWSRPNELEHGSGHVLLTLSFFSFQVS